jgi:hypothetical protein
MRDELLARARRMAPTCATREALLNLFGRGIQVGEYRKCREQEVITVPWEGQEAFTVFLQLASVLTCYNVPPPLDLQNSELAIR